MEQYYSAIDMTEQPAFRMARYVVISPQAENDVIAYMDKWAKDSGLLDLPGYDRRRIGWDFPYVTEEQREKFGLRGYVAAYILPEDFVSRCRGAELAVMRGGTFIKLTVTDPHRNAEERIGGAYKALFDHVRSENLEVQFDDDLCCFEEEYDRGGVHYMDIYVPIARP